MANGFETERKYLIEYPDISLLRSVAGCKEILMTQTYLLNGEGYAERVRKSVTGSATVYHHTAKKDVTAVTRIENEREITKSEYEKLILKADPSMRTIVKTRYAFYYKDNLIEVDVYPFWSDKAIMETELESESDTVELPGFINVIKEVTYDRSFSNYSLAKNGCI